MMLIPVDAVRVGQPPLAEAGSERTVNTVSVSDTEHSAADATLPKAERGQSSCLPEPAGWFRYSFDHDRWEWSAPVARLHGYLPDQVTPDAAVVLSHQHPEDGRQVTTTLEEIRQTSLPLSSRHRIVDAHGRVHHVMVVGAPVLGETGAVTAVHGYYVETSASRDSTHEKSVSVAVAEIAAARAGIEQAKGMLMAVYRIDADAAFELLKWRSQMTNTKVRALAAQIVTDFLTVENSMSPSGRAKFDELLLTAHLRAASGS
jgi:hypothetical protein